MGIYLASIKEGCCDSHLNTFSVIDADALDYKNPTCDKVVACHDKYILVEEKSIHIGFFHECCIALGEDFESYKYGECNEKLNIDDLQQLLQRLSREKKEAILSKKIADLLLSSLDKVSNTTAILCNNPEYDTTKISGMSTFYLYCKTGTPVDRIMHIWLSRYKKNIFIECQDLKEKLEKDCA